MIIVLIGSPFSGKTTLLKILQEKGVNVFQADSFIKKIYKKGSEGYEIIKNRIGEEFVDDEKVNRKKLAKWAIEKDNLNFLNEIIHPIIYRYLDGKNNYVSELPILTSSPIKFNYDKLILITASDKIIEERFNQKKINNQIFIKKIINDWKNLNIKPDLIVDTTYNIKNKDVEKIIKLLNEK